MFDWPAWYVHAVSIISIDVDESSGAVHGGMPLRTYHTITAATSRTKAGFSQPGRLLPLFDLVPLEVIQNEVMKAVTFKAAFQYVV